MFGFTRKPHPPLERGARPVFRVPGMYNRYDQPMVIAAMTEHRPGVVSITLVNDYLWDGLETQVDYAGRLRALGAAL